jgi:hypothetical protein
VCRERKIPQIGNVGNWAAKAPHVFVGFAFADSGVAVTLACRDFKAGRLRVGTVSRIGLDQPNAVRMILADRVPAEVKQRMAGYQADIVAGRSRWPRPTPVPSSTLEEKEDGAPHAPALSPSGLRAGAAYHCDLGTTFTVSGSAK